jgi:dephospho-CoA kinase
LKIIGLTGGIGSGKSTVSAILESLGAHIIDADLVSREVERKGRPAFNQIVQSFGSGILNSDGEIDRNILGDIVFNDSKKLETLNMITHKYIIEEIRKKLDVLKKGNKIGLAVLVAPIPVKHGFMDIVDKVWVVTAPLQTRIKRIALRDGSAYEKAMMRIDAQIGDKDYIDLADSIINNDNNYAYLKKQVELLYNKFMNGKLE